MTARGVSSMPRASRCTVARRATRSRLRIGDELPAEHAERGIHIDPHTATTGWRGERMDYGVAIDSLRFRSAAGQHPQPGGQPGGTT